MKIPAIDLQSHYIAHQKLYDSVVHEVMKSSMFVGGRYLSRFESAFADYCQTTFCLGVANGTDALHIALRCLDVGPGDEVITAANTFIATAEAISLTGATPVFADCDMETMNIDLDILEQRITSRTKVIIPVHLYGLPVDMNRLTEIAARHNLHLVEDSAQAHGSEISSAKAGSLGKIGCFSFYPSKNLGCFGDGGAITTNNPRIFRRAAQFSNHGRSEHDGHQLIGLNSRLDGIQAAILSLRLEFLDQWITSRRQVAAQYRTLLQGDERIILPHEPINTKHSYHQFVIRVAQRDIVLQCLRDAGVDARIHYPIPVPLEKAYTHLAYTPADVPVAARLSKEILSLPIHPELTPEQVEYVCTTLLKALERG